MTELSEINKISKKMLGQFRRAGITTVIDLLYSFPTKFEDYTIVDYDDIVDVDKAVTISGIIQGKPKVMNLKSSLTMMNFYVDVDDNIINATIFNRHFLRNQIFYGKYVRLTGKFDKKKKRFTASEIAFNEFDNAINPIFNFKDISDKKILELKTKLYYEYYHEIEEDLPDEFREEYQLIDIVDAIRKINIPEEMDEVHEAVKRIKFEELFKYQLKIRYLFHKRHTTPEGVAVLYNKKKVDSFIESLPFKLTEDQAKTVDSILSDISSNYKMNRLLQGEVGSGKTVVGAIALYAVVTAGYQGAIMVPTEVLSFQHFKTFTSYFEGTDIKIALLTSSTSMKEKKNIIEELESGKINIIIGTHSLIQKDVNFNRLGLVVTDEEHRFGVNQRVSMVGKGYLIDHLKMTATPIPRTLAISLLGESDISIIKKLPGDRKEVITKYISFAEKEEVFDHMKQELGRGRQMYIITPMINDSSAMDLQNAIKVYEKTKKYYEGICEVGIIHGKLKTEEKEDVMNKFSNNEIQILVSTSVIEVGVNVVNATTMIILDADRFGIAQLHQMRGRVRRSDHQSYCYLVSDTKVESSIKRLTLVKETNDGFALAEEDLLIRGPGEIFGDKQSGNKIFQMADLVVDSKILDAANEAAIKIIDNGKLFNDPKYKRLLDYADKNYQNTKEKIE